MCSLVLVCGSQPEKELSTWGQNDPGQVKIEQGDIFKVSWDKAWLFVLKQEKSLKSVITAMEKRAFHIYKKALYNVGMGISCNM